MDPIQVLALHTPKQHPTVASRAQVDAFYDAHGCETLLRVRRWQADLRRALTALWAKRPEGRFFASSGKKV